ncbi:MAG: hypothetical protein ABSF29_12000 [Tepidisphaeraceae bacterium]
MADDLPHESRAAFSPHRWLIAFLLIGIFLRMLRYAIHMPVWGDEAFVGLNVINRGFADLLKPLEYAQVAPPGFLFAERAMYDWAGMGEYSMRLLPMLAGLGSLLLFAYWVRLLAAPAAAAVAVGILAVGNYPVRYAVELKPYGFDLFASLILVVPATLYFLRKTPRWLIVTILLLPVSLTMSFPAIFVAGGIGLALLCEFRAASRKIRILTGVYALIAAICFLILFKINTASQLQATGPAMTSYWADAFPPKHPFQLLVWLIEIHTGNMFAYPCGAKNGGSIVSFIAFVVGLTIIFRGRGIWLPCVLLGPFALNFLAAMMHRYPYGESARVAQHLAPASVLLIGVGAVGLIDHFSPDSQKRTKAMRTVCWLLVGLGGYIMFYYIFHPYQTRPDADARNLVRSFWEQAPPGAPVAVLEPRAEVQVNFQWYLRAGQDGHPMIWDAQDDNSWHDQPGPLLVVTTRRLANLETELAIDLDRPPVRHISEDVHLGPKQLPPDHFEAFEFSAATSR